MSRRMSFVFWSKGPMKTEKKPMGHAEMSLPSLARSGKKVHFSGLHSGFAQDSGLTQNHSWTGKKRA